MSEQTMTTVGLMNKELRRTAAWIWGETGVFVATPEAMEAKLVEIHDRLTGIEAAFREEIEEACAS